MMSARRLTVCLALVLVASMATSALASCMASPAMSAQAQMACCQAGHLNCSTAGSAADCCKAESQRQQQAAVGKREVSRRALATPVLVSAVTADPLGSLPPRPSIHFTDQGAFKSSSTPKYLLASALLI